MDRTQAAIVYDCLCQLINEGNLAADDLLFIKLAIVRATHPDLYRVFVGLNPSPSINRQMVSAQLVKVLKDRSIKLLESLRGTEVAVNIPMNQLLQELDTHTKRISLNLVETRSVESGLKSSMQKLNSIVQKYQTMVDKYTQEYLIPIKLPSDKYVVGCLAAEAQEQSFLYRREISLRAYEKVGSKEDVERLRIKRKSLEEKLNQLMANITATKLKLKEYSKCDSNLINEYLKVKEQLDERKWAKSLLGNNLSISD